MQPNTITVAVDVANTGTTTDFNFLRFDEFQNRSVYISESHDFASRDTLTLYRTFPKTSGNFRGVAKSAFKYSKDVIVTGVNGVDQITSPVIIEVSFAIPVTTASAVVTEMRQRAVGLLDLDTIMNNLNLVQMV